MVKYKASKNAEEKRERFIDICERYKSENPAVKEKALEDAIQELDGFIHSASEKEKLRSLIWLLHLKNEKYGYTGKDFSL